MLHNIHLNVHFEESSGVFQLWPYVVLKQVSNPIELHDVPWFAFQPEFVKLYEEVAETKTRKVIFILLVDNPNETANSMEMPWLIISGF